MSPRRKLTIEEPKEESENGCGGIEIFFCIFNSLFWIIAIGILGLASWQAAGSTSFKAESTEFTDGMMSVSIITFIMCILGFLASLFNNFQLAGSYVIIFVLLIAVESGLLLACHLTYTTEAAVVEQVWFESNSFIIETTESELQCCGLYAWSDTYESVAVVPAGCVDGNNTIYENGCSDAIITYFTSAAVRPFFLAVLSLSALIQILAFTGGCIFFHKLRMKRKDDAQGSRSHSRNAIFPIVVSPIDFRPEATTQSATSRRDITLNVDTPQQQGNPALFKVASTMLEE